MTETVNKEKQKNVELNEKLVNLQSKIKELQAKIGEKKSDINLEFTKEKDHTEKLIKSLEDEIKTQKQLIDVMNEKNVLLEEKIQNNLIKNKT